MAALSYLHLAPAWLELSATSTAAAASVFVTVHFMREWRAAILYQSPEASPAA
jgi:hypothetical protein